MGHYLSEMQSDTPRMKPVRQGLNEKRRRVVSSPYPEEGSFTEDTVRQEYAADYDVYDWSSHTIPQRKNDPELSDYAPERTFLYSPRANAPEEEQIKFGRQVISSRGMQHKTGRPGQILRRTVTYGPWEVVDETDEHTEGWY